MQITSLSWDDLQRLSALAAEKADDRQLSIDDREHWAQTAERLIDGTSTRNDLRAAAELAELDAALQQDTKVRQRYLELARRASAALRGA